MIERKFQSHLKTIGCLQKDVMKDSKIVGEALKQGNKTLLCGNGGSAVDAQHIAPELTGRYKTERKDFSGKNGGFMNDFCDINIVFPSINTTSYSRDTYTIMLSSD